MNTKGNNNNLVQLELDFTKEKQNGESKQPNIRNNKTPTIIVDLRPIYKFTQEEIYEQILERLAQ